jgi:hypothetical protein
MTRAALAIPLSLLAAAIAMRLALLHVHARFAAALAQPLAVVTGWGSFGALLLAILLLALVLASLGYRALLRDLLLEKRGNAGILAIAAACALSLAAAWLMPVLFSSDVYAYGAYGELARLGTNPYGHARLSPGDPVLDAAIWQWGNPPPTCVYGPAFVAIARATVTLLAPLGTPAQLDGLRVIASLALLLCALLAYAAYPGDRAQRVAAAAMIGLNPVAVWCAAEGHNDAIALCVVLLGFALARRGALGAGTAVAALSGLVKLPGLAAAVVLAFPKRGPQIEGIAASAAGIAVTLVLCVPLFEGVAVHLAPHGRYAPLASFQGVVKPLAWWLVHHDRAASVATMAAAACAALALAVRGVALVRDGAAEGWIWLGLGGWLLIPNPYPWYATWLIAVAALAPRSRAATVAAVVSLASLLRYAPDAAGAPPAAAALALGILATLPFAALRYGRA